MRQQRGLMKKTSIAILALFFLAACTQGGDQAELQQFIGGTTGLAVTFEPNTPPKEAFDGGFSPFDVVVRLENKGEETVKAGDTTVRITGILEPEFNLKSGDLTKKVAEELTSLRKDATGKTLPGNPVFVEFKNFNHVSTITGNALDFPLRADVCYKYATRASTLLCSRSSILQPEPNGICEVTGDKPVANSGSPIQVASVKQAARSANSITFSFDITHVGTGHIYEQSSTCDKSERRYEDNVLVSVETKVPGLSCSRLDSTGEGRVSGFIKMFGGTTTVTCTQT
ncbi:MAG TPA: hypothetical protein VLJ21_01150, partial [Candidatus Binatia bacterium]|nr:hypothetical protein [Candidatus Binatia bacterium]